MKVSTIAENLAKWQIANPRRFLLVFSLISILCGMIAYDLEFDSSFEALLPSDSKELLNANLVREKTGGTRKIVVAIKGNSPERRLAFAREIQKELKKIQEIRFSDLEYPVDFFKDRALWMMPKADLDKLVPALEEAVKVAKWQANPMNLHLDEEKEKEELEAAWGKVDNIVSKHQGKMPFDQVLTSKDGKYTFILVYPWIKLIYLDIGRKLINDIYQAIDRVSGEYSDLEVRTAGNLDIMLEQNQTMVSDLRKASILAFVAIILLAALALRRAGAPFLIGFSLLCGVSWTFAFARIAIGHVNMITGFLVAVLIGLGVDFGIHLYMRFQQELVFFKASPKDAVFRATTTTLQPAITSAGTTAGTFISFVVADFRGFSEFGIIAAVGVIFTLISSFLVLPPLLLIFSKSVKQKAESPEAIRAPKPLSRKLSLSVVVTFVTIVLFGVVHIIDVPFKNNFRKLRGESPATEFVDYVDSNLGAGFTPTVFIADTPKQAEAVKQIVLNQQKEGFDGKPSRISKVFSISDLIPHDAETLRPNIERLREILSDSKLDRAEEKGGKRAEQLSTARKMAKNEPWGIEELPEVFRRQMTTLKEDAYLVYVWPTERNDADHQALAWEAELEALSKKIDAQKIKHLKADETLMMAWIYKTIQGDAIPMVILASIIVFICLLLDFRSLKRTLLVVLPLFAGMMVLVAMIHLLGLELNMFNMVVIPSIIGIGIDNAVHIYHRYRNEGPGSLRLVIRTTGAAALLASLTTGIGFGSTMVSHNVGLQTMGALAVLGIGILFVSATLFFPCVLNLLEKRS